MSATPDAAELAYARGVIEAEARAVADLTERLDDDFFRAAEALLGCQGRVVASGMGKAGIMGMKLSATLASTGTPSIFLHPAEAIHGDLGRIVPEDVVIVLSNSGESQEIVALLPHMRRLGVTLIAVTGNRDSTMARDSDLIIDIGRLVEACPHDLAPTVSTAAMHAIGDALALLVMRRRGFSREQYAMNHPGGALGRRLMRARDVMRTGERLALGDPAVTLRDAICRITEAKCGALLVHETGGKQMVGILTDGDVRRQLYSPRGQEALAAGVGEVMTRDFKSVHPDQFALEALSVMHEHRIGDLPVLDEEGQIVGLLDLKDLIDLEL